MNSRLVIHINGAVQGVGFRPFVYRTAIELSLNGYVKNVSSGLKIEVEGDEKNLNTFLCKLSKDKPQLAIITSLEYSLLDAVGHSKFIIMESDSSSSPSTIVLPDISTCHDCLIELFDCNNRRYLYPFINCTNCGPRFSIIRNLPYDRANTSMSDFVMCSDCRREYENPSDRRFHAEPIACPVCGPQIELWDKYGSIIAKGYEALLTAVDIIFQKKIIAVKGIGGFQLIADANDEKVIKQLRERKKRDEKPFAVMFPNIQKVKECCITSEEEESVLISPEAPIVLLKKKKNYHEFISCSVAVDNPYLGIMLPYSPLHHVIINEFKKPLIATSGNLSEEPICIDNWEALTRLNGIADYFLVHNRTILRHVDDSIARIVKGKRTILRRARGFAPLPINIRDNNPEGSNSKILALGGHLKNTISLKSGNSIFISQHIGDLSTEESFNAFKKVIADFQNLYEVKPEIVVTDCHPDYISTKYALELGIEHKSVQHHYAHIAACRLENEIEGEALGVSWDGTGFGEDKTIWGGEFFYSDNYALKHIGHFKKFWLPGGEQAIKESWRSAIGAIYSFFENDTEQQLPHSLINFIDVNDRKMVLQQLKNKFNTYHTSSVGRLFDAVSALSGLCNRSNYEGEAAMKLEFIADINETSYYPFGLETNNLIEVDWHQMLAEILIDIKNKVKHSAIAAKFHNTLARIILEFAKKTRMNKIVLSGGCFQNLFLMEQIIDLLESDNKKVYWHQRVPPNDGGISLGQIAALINYMGGFERNNFTIDDKQKEN